MNLKNIVSQDIKNIYHFFKAFVAVFWHGYPAQDMKVIGVTGTDGKTTTASLIYHILKTAGKRVALVSTVNAYIDSAVIDTGLHTTTPDPWVLQKLLGRVKKAGIEYVILEATSQGLDQHRLLGTNIKIGVLTNITHDHLDYHKTYENYVKAKSKMFAGVGVAILNSEDKSYSLIKKAVNKKALIRSYNLKTITGTLRVAINKRFGETYNQMNATAAVLAVEGIVESKIVANAIKTFPGVPGRLEEVENKRGIRVFVDFAHTPNALKEVLSYLKSVKKGGRLIAVLGCVGERDTLKRPMMGEIATNIADFSVFTSDDSRSEDINSIFRQMREKAKKGKYTTIVDRFEAIDYAINKVAKRGDIVAVCGKGHEKSLAIGGKEIPWSDVKAVKRVFR